MWRYRRGEGYPIESDVLPDVNVCVRRAVWKCDGCFASYRDSNWSATRSTDYFTAAIVCGRCLTPWLRRVLRFAHEDLWRSFLRRRRPIIATAGFRRRKGAGQTANLRRRRPIMATAGFRRRKEAGQTANVNIWLRLDYLRQQYDKDCTRC